MTAGSEPSRSGSQLRIGELLLEMGFIDRAQLEAALAYQQQTGKRLGKVLVERGIITETRLVRALSKQLGIDVCDPISAPVHERVRALIPRDRAHHYRALPIALRRGQNGDILFVATADPLNRGMVEDLEQLTGLPVGLLLAGETEIDLALARHYGAPVPAVVQRSSNAPHDRGPIPVPIVQGKPLGSSPPGARPVSRPPPSRPPPPHDLSGSGFSSAPPPFALQPVSVPPSAFSSVPAERGAPPPPYAAPLQELRSDSRPAPSQPAPYAIRASDSAFVPRIAGVSEQLPEADASMVDRSDSIPLSELGIPPGNRWDSVPPADEPLPDDEQSWGDLLPPGASAAPPPFERPEARTERPGSDRPKEDQFELDVLDPEPEAETPHPEAPAVSSPPARRMSTPADLDSGPVSLEPQRRTSVPAPAVPSGEELDPAERARLLIADFADRGVATPAQVRWVVRLFADVLLESGLLDEGRLERSVDRIGPPPEDGE